MNREEALNIQIKGETVLYIPEQKEVHISQLPYRKGQTWVCISVTDEKEALTWTKKVDLSEISKL